MDDELRRLVRQQDGVVRRAQLLEHGATPTQVRRLLRRRDLVPVVPGVYVDQTGPPTPTQRAWVAVLALWPAALSHESALRAPDGPPTRGRDALLHVAVDRHRSVAAPPNVVLHHVQDLHERVLWNTAPPRVRVEHALVDVATTACDELEAIAVLADALQARLTTASRLADTLAARPRAARRDLLAGVLADLATGTCSVLEHAYLTRVERPYGLPRGRRQSPGPGLYRDVEYPEQGRSSSSTGARGTTTPSSATATSSATSTRRCSRSRRSGSAAARSSGAAVRPPSRSGGCCSCAAGGGAR